MHYDLNNLVKVGLSSSRMSRYAQWSHGDMQNTLELYPLNMRLSESFYIPLNMLEIALRNKIDTVLTAKHGTLWFTSPQLIIVQTQQNMIKDVQEKTARKHKIPLSHDDYIAHLTFGFWTTLFSKTYENLWQVTLKDIARTTSGKGVRRQEISRLLDDIRNLRNRIAHYEPILHIDLNQRYNNIITLIEWLSPDAAIYTQKNSRFIEVFENCDITLPIRYKDTP